MKLFTKGESNPKIAKSNRRGGIETLILHLAPASVSGHQVCSSASPGCIAACLNTAGRGRMDSVQAARIRRTKMWFTEREAFKAQIVKELTAFVKRCDKLGKMGAVRLNGTSDLLWEKQWPALFTQFADLKFYDYTKHVKRCLENWSLPENYHLTFSRSETNQADCLRVLEAGRHNVAAVFDSKEFPASWEGFPTYSADDDDLRFLDPPGGHVGALYAKGFGKRDETGFVLPVLA